MLMYTLIPVYDPYIWENHKINEQKGYSISELNGPTRSDPHQTHEFYQTQKKASDKENYHENVNALSRPIQFHSTEGSIFPILCANTPFSCLRRVVLPSNLEIDKQPRHAINFIM